MADFVVNLFLDVDNEPPPRFPLHLLIMRDSTVASELTCLVHRPQHRLLNANLANWKRSIVGIASARQSMDMGSNPSEYQILDLFRCVLFSLLPLRSVGRSNFNKGLHNLITMIQERHKIMIELKLLYYIVESTVDSYKKKTLLTSQHVDECPHEEMKAMKLI